MIFAYVKEHMQVFFVLKYNDRKLFPKIIIIINDGLLPRHLDASIASGRLRVLKTTHVTYFSEETKSVHLSQCNSRV